MIDSNFIGLIVISPFIAALVSFIIGKFNKKVRDYFVAAFTLTELAAFVFAYFGALEGVTFSYDFHGLAKMGIHYEFAIDGFRFIYVTLALLMWAMCSLASRRYFAHYHNRNRYYFFWLVTLGGTLGVFLSANLLTAFTFFEIMSMASYVFVAQEETEGALKAAETYLAVAVIGGLVSLMGIFIISARGIGIDFDSVATYYAYGKLETIDIVAAVLLLFGFGAKAGIFPMHIWLPKAHPVAPAPASAVLSGMLTKVGIFGTIFVCCRCFSGNDTFATVMLILAVITMLLGAILALFSTDLKRTLACSSVSQIGFILTGIAMQMYMLGNDLAVAGTFLHMMNHSLFKLALFLVAGIVMQNLHKLDLNEIRGFGRKKYYLMLVYLCAALGIGGIPLWSGYISKTLLHESIVEGIEKMPMLKVVEILFLFAGGITLAYMTKLFVAIFVEKNLENEEKMRESDSDYITIGGRIAIGVPAVLILLFGLFPVTIYEKFAKAAAPFFIGNDYYSEPIVHYFEFECLKGALVSVAIGAILYFGVVRTLLMKKTEKGKIYVNRWPSWLDIETGIYRPLLKLLADICGTVARAIAGLPDLILLGLRKTVYRENSTESRVVGNSFTFFFGSILNGIVAFLNKTFCRSNPIEKDFVLVFAEDYEIDRRKLRIIEGSLSFGLLMFCIGLCVTMIYLLAQ